MDKECYREALRTQISNAYDNVRYTYKAHHKFADRLEKHFFYLRLSQIVVTAVSSGGFVGKIATGCDVLMWIAGLTSVLSLGMNLYSKEYKLQNEINMHRGAANELWDIREEYDSLRTEFDALENSAIVQKRDMLCHKVSSVNRHYPATDEKSYMEARLEYSS